jgi:hypothetical protein
MPDFNVRSDSVNVEQIMEQIRMRIREKRGVDYTEQQIRELAAVKLEKFLDPRGVRSDLLDQFRKAQPAYEPPELPNFAFEDATLFESHRAPIRWLRKLLMPLLKLLFNPNPLIQALHIQARLNTMNAEREAKRESARRAMDQLYYELVHNLVVETTRTGIEVKNLKMRVESISSRLEFNERRARALEGAVVYKAAEVEAPAPRPAPPVQQQPRQQAPSHQPQPRYTPPPVPPVPVQAAPVSQAAATAPIVPQGQSPQGQGPAVAGEGPGQRSRRRRRRRGRRGGGAASAIMGSAGSGAPEAATDAQESEEAVDQIDAMGGMDDDPAPESAESHDAAVGDVEQATAAELHRAEPVVTLAPEGGAPVEHARAEQADPPRDEAAPAVPGELAPASPTMPDHAEPAPAPPAMPDHAEPAPAPPTTPDHADHDPQ